MQSKSTDGLYFILAAISAQIIGGTITQLSPLVIGAVIVGLQLTAQQAGYIASVEFIEKCFIEVE